MDISLTGRTAFITGGTGSVGGELVALFSRSGARVIFQYKNNEVEAGRLEESFGARAIKLDLLEEVDLPDVSPDILVNNAGINISKELCDEISAADWQQTIAVNLMAPIRLSLRYLPAMVERHWGRIVNVSSIYGIRSTSRNGPYNVSKHGLSGLTKSIARDYAEFGITCNEVCPGPIESNLMRRIAADKERDSGIPSDVYLAEARRAVPTRRLASVTDVAAAALFLASDLASHVNGASLVVDGGATA